jgi:cytoplasmic FMR1 interacting protein
LSLVISIAPTHNPLNFSDHNAFDHMFVNEMETKAAIEQLLDEGSHFVDMLYTFRSVSRAIPMINDQNAPNKAELNRSTFDVLRPEIVKLKVRMRAGNEQGRLLTTHSSTTVSFLSLF